MAKRITDKRTFIQKITMATLATILLGPMALATKPTPAKTPDPTVFSHKYEAFTAELKKYVVINGAISTVDYKRWAKDRKNLDALLQKFSKISEKEFKSWTEKQQLAFLVNAYNGFTIQLILNKKPKESIKDIGGLFSSPWKKEFFTLLGKKRYLDWIEHGVIRKKYNAPRTHFALNCASIGCPRLLNEAYQEHKWEEQLDLQTKVFLTDKKRNYLKSNDKEIYLSKIFDWFEEDFVKKSGSVRAFVLPYMTDDKALAEKIKKEKWDIEHTKYDWKLNKN
tara:strand:+ start:95147 stop:95986 length:840 start_codon:yes stop_codon:yes gene_type:complete